MRRANLVVGPWVQRGAPKRSHRKRPRSQPDILCAFTPGDISGALKLPQHSGIIEDDLFWNWFELVKGHDPRFNPAYDRPVGFHHFDFTHDRVRYSVVCSDDEEKEPAWGILRLFDRASPLHRCYCTDPCSRWYADREFMEAANANMNFVLKERLTSRQVDRILEEVERQLEFLQPLRRSNKYGEVTAFHKWKWWRLQHRSKLFPMMPLDCRVRESRTGSPAAD